MDRRVDRRTFVGTAAGITTAVAVAGAQEKKSAESQDRRQEARDKVPPSERLTVALIGCGGMGRANLVDFLRAPEVEVAAVCDVDSRRWKDALKDIENAAHPTSKVDACHDFRRVIERKDIDAVIIGTPDHWHAIPTIYACQAGKDVYCEKPLSHNIVEGRAMVNAARKSKRVVQIGTQQRSGAHFQDAVKYVQSGKLGKIHIVRTWIINRNNSPDGDGNPADCAPPKEVDYNLWLGPAPERPFNPVRFHYNFRWFWDYGNGLCNDWGVHLNDIVLWAMQVRAPLAVCASGGKYVLKDISDTPDTLEVVYDYPGFTHIYSVRRCCDNACFRGMNHGIEFQGSDGTLVLDRGGWQVLAEKKGDGKEDRIKPERHGGSDQHWPHVQNFIQCVKTRGKTNSDIEDMHRATTTCHLANISYKVGRKIYWDADAEACRFWDNQKKQLTGLDAEANGYLLREPRKPWTIPMVS
jgi:predicted dehydrogenase